MPVNLRRLPFRVRKRLRLASDEAWTVPEPSGRRSVDRSFPTVASPVVNGGDEQTDYDFSRRASLEEGPGPGRLQGGRDEENAMESSLFRGFLDEVVKAAAQDPGVLSRMGTWLKAAPGRVEAAGRDVAARTRAGYTSGGWKGGLKGLWEGAAAHPKIAIPAAAGAGLLAGRLLAPRKKREAEE